tara:strand:- start:5564 stop:5845 length:282 start_codon:yes stop_codon:yes gene_type:complete
MKLKELMERIGMVETGKAIAYVKDGLEEINMLTEVSTEVTSIDIVKDKRFYSMPNDMVQMLDITAKNHLNAKDEYRTIPRMIHKPPIKDEDDV